MNFPPCARSGQQFLGFWCVCMMKLLPDIQPVPWGSKRTCIWNKTTCWSFPTLWELTLRGGLEDAKATRLWVLVSDVSKTSLFYFAQLPSTCLNMHISDGERKCLAFLEKWLHWFPPPSLHRWRFLAAISSHDGEETLLAPATLLSAKSRFCGLTRADVVLRLFPLRHRHLLLVRHLARWRSVKGADLH